MLEIFGKTLGAVVSSAHLCAHCSQYALIAALCRSYAALMAAI